MTRLVKTRIDCEHRKETVLAQTAPIFRADTIYWIACDECGRVRKIQHGQSLTERARKEAVRRTEQKQTMEIINPFGKDD